VLFFFGTVRSYTFLATRFESGRHISRRIMMLRSVLLRMLRTPFPMLQTLFPCCEHIFPCCEHFFHVAPPPSSLDIVYMLQAMLRVCGEHVASLWRACWDQHPTSCCEHFFYDANTFSHVANTFSMLCPPSSHDIVYMLRAMLRACGEHVASL
jgi:hypothetical protein